MPDELRSGPGPKYGLLDGFSDMFRNKLQGPSYFDDATAIVNRLMARPSTSQRLASWEYERAPPMPNEGQQNILGRLLSAVPDNVMLASNFIGPGAKPQGIRAYHGSPHSFDKFDMSKIGTGEGAQAFGRGLYFAENEGTANSYKTQLTDRTNFVRPDGTLWSADGLEHMNVRATAYRGNLDAAIEKAKTLANGEGPTAALAARDLNRLLDLKNSGGIKPNTGHMYEVNINANPDHFLDWDKPLGQQSDALKAVIEPALRKAAEDMGRGASPEKIAQFENMGLKDVADRMRPKNIDPWSLDVKDVAQQYPNALREAGVPGIKYLDEGSRFKGEGTRNYVVFDDKIIDILRKYGLAPPAIAAGASAMSADQQ